MSYQKVGARIICNQDGEILFTLSEMEGDVLQREEIADLHCVDLDFGQVDYSEYYISAIDMNTMQPILERVEYEESDEQKQIRQLQDDLLLMQLNAEIGGLL